MSKRKTQQAPQNAIQAYAAGRNLSAQAPTGSSAGSSASAIDAYAAGRGLGTQTVRVTQPTAAQTSQYNNSLVNNYRTQYEQAMAGYNTAQDNLSWWNKLIGNTGERDAAQAAMESARNDYFGALYATGKGSSTIEGYDDWLSSMQAAQARQTGITNYQKAHAGQDAEQVYQDALAAFNSAQAEYDAATENTGWRGLLQAAAAGVSGGTMGATDNERVSNATAALNSARDNLNWATQQRYNGVKRDNAFYESVEAGRQQGPASALKEGSWVAKTTTDMSNIDLDDAISQGTPVTADMLVRKKVDEHSGPTDKWTKDQTDMYYYLIGQGRTQDAVDYAYQVNDDIQYQVFLDASRHWGNWASDNPLLSSAATVGETFLGLSRADYLNSLMEYNATGRLAQSGDMNGTRFNATVRGAISNELNQNGVIPENVPVVGGKGLGDAYQLAMSIADSMVTTRVPMKMTGGVGTGMTFIDKANRGILEGFSLTRFFGSAASQGIYDALDRGLDPGQAIALGTLNGVAEVLGEKFSVEGLINQDALSLKSIFRQIAVQGLTEGSEEGFTTLLNTAADLIVAGDKAELRQRVQELIGQGMSREEAEKAAIKEWVNGLAFDMLGGAISGAASAGMTHAASFATAYDKSNGRADVNALQDMASTLGEGDKLNQQIQDYAAKLEAGKFVSEGRLGQLQRGIINATNQRNSSDLQTATAERLKSRGETENVDAVAKAIVDMVQGKRMSAESRQLINSSKYGQTVLNELQTAYEGKEDSEVDTAWAKEIHAATLDQGSLGKSRFDTAVEKRRAEDFHRLELKEKGENGLNVVADDVRLKADSNGKVEFVVKDKDGSERTVSQDEVELSADQEVAITMLQGLLGRDAAAAFNVMTLDQMEHGAIPYATAFATIRDQFGRNGAKLEAAMASPLAEGLTEAQVTAAYELGKQLGPQTAEQRQHTEKGGKVSYGGGRLSNGTVLKPVKSKVKLTGFSQRMFRALGEALQIDIKLFEDPNAPNGVYDNGVIYINVAKNVTNQDMFYRVLSHELTHFIQANAEEEYLELKKFVQDHLRDSGLNYNELVKQKLAREKGISYKRAEDEVVADACETMLFESKTVEQLAQEAPGAFNAIHKWIKQFVDKFTGKGGSFAIFDEAEEMRKYAKELQEIWDRALAKAVRNRTDPTAPGAPVGAAGAENIDIDGNPGEHQASITSMVEGAGFTFVADENGNFKHMVDSDGNIVKKVTPDHIAQSPIGNVINIALDRGFIGEDDVKAQRKMFADLMNMVAEYHDSTMVWETIGTTIFSAMKSNSDTQYSKTIDFSTVCKKTQAIVDAMSATMLKLGRGLTREEVETVYLETHKAGETVPCPVCYVFSRWMGAGGILDNIKKYQNDYGSMSEQELIDFALGIRQEVEDYWTAQGKHKKYEGANGEFKTGKAISDMKTKLGNHSNSRLKSLAASANAALKIQELEAALEAGVDKKTATKLRNQIKSQQKKILDDNGVKAVEKDVRADGSKVEQLEAYQFIMKSLLTEEKDGTLHMNEDYAIHGPVPDNVLFDLNKGAEFAERYPAIWAYRTTRGAAAGKAITPYADARVGETIQGVYYASVRDIKGGQFNPFLNGDVKTQGSMVDSAIKKMKRQNLIGGQRYQSTSDFRYEYGSDYLMTFLEMQAIGANVQLYTKVIEAVDFFASVGADCNLSLMPLGDGFITMEDGSKKLVYSDITGINYEAALKKTQEYDNVQLILVGISDEHIRLAIGGDEVTFCIPFHGSGNTTHQIQALMNMVGEDLDVITASDYTAVQSDHFKKRRTQQEKDMWKLRTDIIMGNAKELTPEQVSLIGKNPYLAELYDKFYVDKKSLAYENFLGKDQAEHIFPYEYWDEKTTIDTADENGRRFQEYCKSMGIIPRFSGKDSDGKNVGFGDFTRDKGYWKLLIDRRMYNLDGSYHKQQQINVSAFKVDMLDGNAAKLTYGDAMSKANDPSKTNGIRDRVLAQIDPENYGPQMSLDNVEAAAKRWGAVTDKNGKPQKFYHGTRHFGWTTYDLGKNTASKGMIYATSKANVAANYAGVDYYAFVRDIGKRLRAGNSASDIIHNAKQVLGRDFHVAQKADRSKTFKAVYDEAMKVLEQIDPLYNAFDELSDYYDEVIKFETEGRFSWEKTMTGRDAFDRIVNLFYTVTGINEDSDYAFKDNGALEDYYFEDLKSACEDYGPMLAAFRKFLESKRGEMSEDGKKLYKLFTNYSIFDTSVDIIYKLQRAMEDADNLVDTRGHWETQDHIAEVIDAEKNIGAYQFYVNPGSKVLTVNADGKDWLSLNAPEMDNKLHSTDAIAKWARDNGYSAVLVKNVYDGGENADEYILFDGKQAKSADAVTYDDNDREIPLSERFNEHESDIRYSLDDVGFRIIDIQNDDTSYINTSEKNHTPAENKIIADYIASTDANLKKFYIRAAHTGQNSKTPFVLKPVSARMAADITRETGNDVSGFGSELIEKQAWHVYNDHGPHGQANVSMRNPNDVGRLQYVLDNYDALYKGTTTDAFWEPHPKKPGRQRQATTVFVLKQLDHTVCIIQAVPVTAKRKVEIVTAFMIKKGERPTGTLGKIYDQIIAAAGTSQLPDAFAPWYTPNSDSVTVPAADNSIADSAAESNTQSDTFGPQSSLDDVDYGYHAGDLGKAEPRARMDYNRDTGHFGTGTYFVGTEAKINDSYYGARPHEKVNFAKYNLFKPKTSDDGYTLHRFLQGVNRFYGENAENIPTRKELDRAEQNVEEIWDNLYEENEDESWMRDEDMDDATWEFLVGEGLYKVVSPEERLANFREAFDRAVPEAVKVLGEHRVKSAIAESVGLLYDQGEYYDWNDGDIKYFTEEQVYERMTEESMDRTIARIQAMFNDYYATRYTGTRADWADSFSDAAKLLGISEKKLKETLARVRRDVENAGPDTSRTDDSASTRFMKALGYEGVDVRGTDLDNTMYGSVIYDLKGEDLARKQEIGTARFSIGGGMTDREMLADAFKTLTKDQQEDETIARYKRNVDKYNRVEKDLQAERKKLQAMVKAKAPQQDIFDQRDKINSLSAKLARADKQLLSLERSKVLRDIITQQRAEQRTKDRERVNESLGKKQAKAVVLKQAKTLSDWIMKNSDKEHVPEALKEPIIGLLEVINFDSATSLRTGGAQTTQADARFGARLQQLQAILQNQQQLLAGENPIDTLSQYLDISQDSLDFLKDMAEVINNYATAGRGNFTINQMSAEELKNLAKFLKTLTHAIRQANKFLSDIRYESVKQGASETLKYMDKLGKVKRSDGLRLVKFLKWEDATPWYAMKRFGKMGEAIIDSFTRGWEKLAFNAQEVIEFTEKTYTPAEVNAWKKELHKIKLEDGTEIQMTTAQIMEFTQLVTRPQALQHITNGGIRIGNIEDKKGAIVDTTHYHVSPNDFITIMDQLTPRQLAVARTLRTYMGKRGGEWGNEISMKRFGYYFYTEGESYYPIKTDGNTRALSDTEAKANEMFRLLNLSSSKALNPKATNALVVGDIFDTFADHMADMAKLNALGLPLLDAIKWYNYTERTDNSDGTYTVTGVKGAMEQAFGKAAQKYFATLIKDINGATESGDRGTGIFAYFMSNAKVASVAANMRVAVLQPTSYVRAMAVLEPRYMIAALGMRGNHKEALKYSGTAVWKSLGYYDTNIARGLRDQIKNNASIKDKIVEKSMTLAEKGDNFTWGKLWTACKMQTKAQNPQLTGEDLNKATADLFREVVYATQVMDGTLNRSQVMRGTSQTTKAITAFMAEPTLSYNLIMDAYSQYELDARSEGKQKAWQNNRGKLMRGFMTYVCSAAFSAIAESMWDAVRDDDDYETYWQKVMQAFFGEGDTRVEKMLDGNLWQDLSIIGKIPILKEIISSVQGYKDSNMATQFLEQTMGAWRIWDETIKLNKGTLDKATATTWYGKMTTYTKIYKTLQALSNMTGLPMSAATRDAVAIWNFVVGGINPSLKVDSYAEKPETAIVRSYKDGNLTRAKAIDDLMKDAGMTQAEAEAKIDYADFQLANPNSKLSQNKTTAYIDYVEKSGLEAKDYEKILGQLDTDGNGSPSQGEAYPVLQQLIKDGTITRNQAEAIWKSLWHGKNSATFGNYKPK